MIQNPRTPPRVSKLLSEIPGVKKFGEAHGLKPTKNYTDYVKLDRPAASYVVSACEPLAFKPRTWSFPIVGSFTYLGWFDLGMAKEQVEEIRKEGLDVDLRGARAFSTLGWFRDAVLSTMIPEGDEALGELVNVILHESVHSTLYIGGQSSFNESVASYVADRLTPEYLSAIRGAGSSELLAYKKSEEWAESYERHMHQAYGDLESLYGSKIPDAEKLKRKAEILGKLKADLGLKKDINNATIIQFRTYGVAKAEFEALLKSCGEDWTRFWASLRTLKDTSFSKSQQEEVAPVVLELAKRGCRG